MHREQERAAAILDRRTAVLAARESAAAVARATPRRAVILWSVGAARAAMDLGHVAAVIPFAGCAAVPTQLAACLGVIGWSGRVHSVISMRALAGTAGLALPEGDGAAAGEAPRHLILLRGAAPHLALAVDSVLGRFDLPDTGETLEHDGTLLPLLDPAALRTRLGGAAGRQDL